MPRKPRFFVPNIPCHIVQRGNNREPIFFESENNFTYLGWLAEALDRYECELHAYVLMTNHVHLLISPKVKQGISLAMQYLGRHYVPYINYQYKRCGTLWESRYKANLVDSESYLITCMRYIELNPVRAGMVNAPGEYKWSSYKSNALGREESIITPHAEYLSLGEDVKERAEIYRELFRSQIDNEDVSSIQSCCQTGTPLGSDRFREKIERTLKMKVGHDKRGRPKTRKEKGL